MKAKKKYEKPALLENATFERRGVLAGCAVNAQTGSCTTCNGLSEENRGPTDGCGNNYEIQSVVGG